MDFLSFLGNFDSSINLGILALIALICLMTLVSIITKQKVIFRPKSEYQKDNCINRSTDYCCPNESVLEAVYQNSRNSNSAIRCCEDEKCMKKAAEIAKYG
jgi:hypothetical protein